jgi:hypothetical protein
MRQIDIQIKDGKISIDFSGFEGRACEKEENAITAIFGSMGVTTDVEHSDNKREREANPIAEGQKVGN